MMQSRSGRLDGRGVHRYMPKRSRDYQQVVSQSAMAALVDWRHRHKQNWDPTAKFELHCDFYHSDHRARDTSNLGKQIEDALNKVVWDDDSQIYRLVWEKHFSERPRAQIRIIES